MQHIQNTRSICSILCCFLLLGLSGCVEQTRYLGPDPTDPQSPDPVVCADLAKLPQDLTVYAAKAGANTILLDADRQRQEDVLFDIRFFKPWGLAKARSAKQAFWAIRTMNPGKAYIENNRPFPRERWDTLVANCDIKKYPGKIRYGITVRNTSLRLMPTETPFFLHPRKGGEGFPFDYFQNSALWAGAPVAITHTSKDGLWAYAETRAVSGWLPVDHVAEVDKATRDRWQATPLVAILADKTILHAVNGPVDAASGQRTAIQAHIGAMFPFVAEKPGQGSALRVLIPVRDSDGKAKTRIAELRPDQAAVKPLPLTPGHIAQIGNGMMGQPYGWGGMFENRDCSAATRDLLAPFGIWLPRNSGEQGRWGRQVTVTGQLSDDKERVIASAGVPFFSLVRMKGHVGLYLGTHLMDGVETPVMFHNVWGLRVNNPYKASPALEATSAGTENGQDAEQPMYSLGAEDRAVIGKAVVTTLRPGAELPWIATPASILDRIDGLSILPEAETKAPASRAIKRPIPKRKVMKRIQKKA